MKITFVCYSSVKTLLKHRSSHNITPNAIAVLSWYKPIPESLKRPFLAVKNAFCLKRDKIELFKQTMSHIPFSNVLILQQRKQGFVWIQKMASLVEKWRLSSVCDRWRSRRGKIWCFKDVLGRLSFWNSQLTDLNEINLSRSLLAALNHKIWNILMVSQNSKLSLTKTVGSPEYKA